MLDNQLHMLVSTILVNSEQLQIVALGNLNPHLVENVGQVEGAGQTHIRCEQGKCI